MDEDLRRVLAEQAIAIAEIRESTRLIYKYIYWQRIWGWFKLAVIIIPLIAAAVYLPSVIKDWISTYSSL